LEITIDGARGVLFNITGGPDMTMNEVNEAAKIIGAAADADAKIIFGATIDETLIDQIKVTVIATGFDENRQRLKDLRFERNFTPQVSQMSQNMTNVTNQTDDDTIEKPAVETPAADEFGDDFDIPAFLRKGK
jgi:cell division protein FtsZ